MVLINCQEIILFTFRLIIFLSFSYDKPLLGIKISPIVLSVTKKCCTFVLQNKITIKQNKDSYGKTYYSMDIES